MHLEENTVFDLWPRSQGHTRCCPVLSTLCDQCTCKMWSFYVQRFRMIYAFTRKYSIWPLTLGSMSHEMLPSTLYMRWPISSWFLSGAKHLEKIDLGLLPTSLHINRNHTLCFCLTLKVWSGKSCTQQWRKIVLSSSVYLTHQHLPVGRGLGVYGSLWRSSPSLSWHPMRWKYKP